MVVCPNCQFNNPPDAKYCSNCGYKLMADQVPPSSPPPYGQYGTYYGPPPYAYPPYHVKSPGVAVILALVLGLFGLMGIGHIYVGRIGRGLIILLAGFALNALGILGFIFGLFLIPSGLFLFGLLALVASFVLLIWQTYDAYMLANEYNARYQQTGRPPW